MKKWLISLTVIIAVVIYFAWPKTNMEKPIVMSVQFEEETKTLAVSYIVHRNNDTYVMEIAHDTKGFYPPRTNGYWDGKTNYTRVIEAQNGYELREDIVELTDDELAYFLAFEGRALPIEISFENHSPIETILILVMENEVANIVAEDQILRYTFTSPKDLTIDSIGHFDSVALISFEQDGKEVAFPLTLTEGNTVDILIHEPYKLSTNDRLLLEITTIDDQSYTKNILMTEPIPKRYLKQIVKEVKGD